nr:hypothetical protein [Acidicapsa acidisoli]
MRLWSGRGFPSAPRRNGLSASALLVLVGVQEALQAQVVVPLDGESLMLLVQGGQRDVSTADEIATPLLNAEVARRSNCPMKPARTS